MIFFELDKEQKYYYTCISIRISFRIDFLRQRTKEEENLYIS